MVLTPSTMVTLGSKAPEFQLKDVVSGKFFSLSELKSETGTVIMFICNHCPYVKHVQEEIVNLANDFKNKNISFIAISSNDIETYPEDGPEKMKETALEKKYPFPYLFDETQNTAKAYNAACTPDFFIYDKELKLIYRGQLDDSRPENNKPITGNDVREALNNVINGNLINPNQKPSMGCNIKWKKE
ncbi:MAG: Antioxidant, AhpC/TSA family [Candidatus Peregrinibacteria bacterium GW2011_GWA2_33_10]|nr:MAG: Antioxidant, AhpC/TSA family [Candidatus Peregrinibacteria bacterium GW2011_GWA2_33_10]KKP39787.1 MAG: thiol-disulfide isomerase and thioredoxin [Candidatus Peregrinibacteria bacterium GW2011_GWC2_33_13]